jgi:hypothetical protein
MIGRTRGPGGVSDFEAGALTTRLIRIHHRGTEGTEKTQRNSSVSHSVISVSLWLNPGRRRGLIPNSELRILKFRIRSAVICVIRGFYWVFREPDLTYPATSHKAPKV